jgi:pimeloyl-ACP methyl ester carboxylesterase
MAFAATHPALAGGIVLIDADVRRTSNETNAHDVYRFHPLQASTFADVRDAVDRHCAPELLELLAASAETPRGGFRRDATKALQRMRWAVRDEISPAGQKVVTKMDPEWCFFATRRALEVRTRCVTFTYAQAVSFAIFSSSFTVTEKRRDVDGTVRASTPARARRTDTASPGPRD